MDPVSCMLSFGLACAPAPPAEAEPSVAEPPIEKTAEAESDTPAPGSAVEALSRVQKYYDSTKDLKASFTQTYTHPVYGTKTVSKGTVKLKRPGMMVWDYAKKSDPDFYADGNTLWVIERDTRQVVTRDVQSSDFSGAVQFLFGGRKLVQDFYVRLASEKLVARYGQKGHTLIELMPKKNNPHYKRLLLAVDPDSGRVDSFVIRNGDDSTNHFVLAGVSTNNGLAASVFKLKVPSGYSVIRE